MNHELSVIIVNYNTKDDLRNCLASIYASSQVTSLKSGWWTITRPMAVPPWSVKCSPR